MEKPLQQRLVGAVVLVALGVILIPALLDGSGYKIRHGRSLEIPPRPDAEKTRVTRGGPVAKTIKLEKKSVVDKAAVDKPAVNKSAVNKPLASPLEIKRKTVQKKKKVDPPAKIESWALQVGTFSEKSNATTYRDDLRKQGHKAYVEPYVNDGSTSYRVRIGPELEKSRVESLKKRLKKEASVDAFIVAHP